MPETTIKLKAADSSLARDLNRGCACRFLDPQRLRRQLEAEPALAGLAEEIARSRSHLFSATAVFITQAQHDAMAAVVRAVEDVVALPAWHAVVLREAPAIAGQDHGPQGAFLGFDFHLGIGGPHLIEINTNAGGALLNAALTRAQQACCAEVEAVLAPAPGLAGLEAELLAMFAEEWRRQRGAGLPRSVAIVDDDPAGQYLYPEFQLFERLFTSAGIRAVIADARALRWEAGRLWHREQALDLVYNRLTDFYLEAPEHTALRAAYAAGAVVLTPHPHAHALYADKRNLALLSDPDALFELSLPPATRATLLATVPRTEIVSAERAEALWAARKTLFFKPAAGFGSRAAYRGDKLTRRVWQEILAGGYVAQHIAPPGERLVAIGGERGDLKFDVRAYAYAGRIQLLAARLYSGQTTNFRTPGGGFAPVFVVAP